MPQPPDGGKDAPLVSGSAPAADHEFYEWQQWWRELLSLCARQVAQDLCADTLRQASSPPSRLNASTSTQEREPDC